VQEGHERMEQAPRRRRLVAAVGLGAVIALATSGLVLAFVANDDGEAGGTRTPTTVVLHLEPEDIYPSLSTPQAQPHRQDYPKLFVAGRTLRNMAMPACPRYREVRRTWRTRGLRIVRDSQGAGVGPKTAARYYASVVWVSQDEADDFRRAIFRISRSRVSAATEGAVRRGNVIEFFTRDALAICNLTQAYGRTLGYLERVDERISSIIALARRNSSSGSEVNSIQ
jgi:hypothetical protein